MMLESAYLGRGSLLFRVFTADRPDDADKPEGNLSALGENCRPDLSSRPCDAISGLSEFNGPANAYRQALSQEI